MASLLSIRALSASLGGSQILRNVELSIAANEVFCLMGRNGVGKTTLLKTLVGLVNPTQGEIHLEGVDLLARSASERACIGLGYVPQGREIFPNLTVFENLRVGAAAQRKQSAKLLQEVLELFPALADMLSRKGGVLSGGQQQQLAIARALLTSPKLLILDEPTEGIQPNVIDQIAEVLKKLRGKMAILLVEQYLEFAKELADSFAIMDRGAVVTTGPIDDLSETLVSNYLTV